MEKVPCENCQSFLWRQQATKGVPNIHRSFWPFTPSRWSLCLTREASSVSMLSLSSVASPKVRLCRVWSKSAMTSSWSVSHTLSTSWEYWGISFTATHMEQITVSTPTLYSGLTGNITGIHPLELMLLFLLQNPKDRMWGIATKSDE